VGSEGYAAIRIAVLCEQPFVISRSSSWTSMRELARRADSRMP